MRRLFTCIILFIMCVSYASAQTQQGIVKTRGRMDNGQLVAGTRLSGATITLNFGNSLVSGSQGEFSFNVPSGKTYSLVMAEKKGYTLADPEYTRRSFSYSASNPFYVVLEDVNQRQADINAATRKVRRTLTAQLQKREEEIEALKEQNKLSEEDYQKRLQELYDNQSKSEQLVKEMAERYASTDYDLLDEFNRQVQMYIEEGELQKADSMIRSKGDMEKRVEEYHNAVKANKQERQELNQREAQLVQSEAGAAKTYEDLSQDLFRKSEIFLQEFKQDSALYYLKLRADLDTTNVKVVQEYAILCYKQKKFADCERYSHICLRSYINQNDIPNIAAIQNNFGILYRELHDYTDSEKFYKSALENKEQLFRQNPDAYRADLAMTQNNLGNLYSDLQDYDNSEKYYKAALENFEQLFRLYPDVYRADFAVTQNNLGNIYCYLHNYTNSVKHYMSALENKEHLFLQNPDAYRADLAMTQSNLGNMYNDLQDYANSEKYYKLALENYEKLFLQNPNAYRVDLAMTQNNLGNLYSDLQYYANSEKSYKAALENYEQMFRLYPDAYRENLANTQSNLGSMYLKIHDFANSEKYYKAALQNFEQLSHPNPKNLAVTQNNLGILYSNLQDYANSEKYFTSALENYEHLFRQNPNAYRADLADTQNNLGVLYLKIHDFANSEKYYRFAMDHREQLFSQNPNTYRVDLAMTYRNMIRLYIEMNDWEQCDHYLEKTLILYADLYKSQPTSYGSYMIELQNIKVWRLLRNGEFVEAMKLAEATYAMDESVEQSKAYLAVCYNMKTLEYAKASEFDNAHTAIDKAISLVPNDPNFYDSKGEIFMMQGKNDEALKMWKKVLELNPDFLKGYPDGTDLSNGLKKLGLIE